MKTGSLIPVFAVALLGGLLSACTEGGEKNEARHSHDAPPHAASRGQRATDGSVTITLDAETQQRIGLRTAPPAPGVAHPDVKAYGRVLDPAPLVALVVESATSKTALEASTRELRRVRSLLESQNASARALEAAEAACQRDQIAFEAAYLKLMSAWGKAVADRSDLSALAKALAASEAALVRLDLPAGESVTAPREARLFTLTAPDQPINADYIGPAAAVDSQAQGLAFLFLVKSAESGLRPGQALLGYVRQPGEPLAGVIVPPAAVVRAVGQAWVYVQTSATTFSRRDIVLDRPIESGWLVGAGLSAKDRLVVTGAQMLYSEELKSSIKVWE